MRFSGLFALSALAASAFASPIKGTYEEPAPTTDVVPTALPTPTEVPIPSVGNPKYVVSSAAVPVPTEAIPDVDEASPEGEDTPETPEVPTVKSCDDVIHLFEEKIEKIKGNTGSISTFLHSHSSPSKPCFGLSCISKKSNTNRNSTRLDHCPVRGGQPPRGPGPGRHHLPLRAD